VHAEGLWVLIERKQALDKATDVVRRQVRKRAAEQLLQRVPNEDLRGSGGGRAGWMPER
jgi:hypothetical protein